MTELTIPQPWLPTALSSADFRPGERVLQLTAHDPRATATIVKLCGSNGLVVVVEPSQRLAEQVRQLPDQNLHVIAIDPDGDMQFGRFDAVFAAPIWSPGWEPARFGEILRRCLRPGGRFVLDLPAEMPAEAVRECWHEIGEPMPERLERWRGIAEGELADALRAAGLRRVEGVVGTHLAHYDSPFEVARVAVGAGHFDWEQASVLGAIAPLAASLTRRLGSHIDVEIVVHRTRVRGMR